MVSGFWGYSFYYYYNPVLYHLKVNTFVTYYFQVDFISTSPNSAVWSVCILSQLCHWQTLFKQVFGQEIQQLIPFHMLLISNCSFTGTIYKWECQGLQKSLVAGLEDMSSLNGGVSYLVLSFFPLRYCKCKVYVAFLYSTVKCFVSVILPSNKIEHKHAYFLLTWPIRPWAACHRPCGSTFFLPFVTSSVLTVKDKFVR